jgi:hypothetical protein
VTPEAARRIRDQAESYRGDADKLSATDAFAMLWALKAAGVHVDFPPQPCGNKPGSASLCRKIEIIGNQVKSVLAD